MNVREEFRERLSADCYLVRHEGAVEYSVTRLVSDRHEWRYIGATHEFIHSGTAETLERLDEVRVVHHEDGGSRADKYPRDLELLKRELAEDPNNGRVVFYLAQTYRDMGNLAQAMEWYERRTSMGGWDEEVWYSLYQVARCQHRLGLAWPLVLSAYLTAYEFRPTRLEPLFYVARFYREQGEQNLSRLFSKVSETAVCPNDLLFIEKAVYERGVAEAHAPHANALMSQQ